MTYSEIIGKKILKLCEDRKWSINLVATLADLPHSTVNNIVNGKHPNPTILTIHSIAKAFEMSLSEFLDIDELNNLTLLDIKRIKSTRKK